MKATKGDVLVKCLQEAIAMLEAEESAKFKDRDAIDSYQQCVADAAIDLHIYMSHRGKLPTAYAPKKELHVRAFCLSMDDYTDLYESGCSPWYIGHRDAKKLTDDALHAVLNKHGWSEVAGDAPARAVAIEAIFERAGYTVFYSAPGGIFVPRI